MSEQSTQSELENLRQTFRRQARTFRALAKMFSKDPQNKTEAFVCQTMVEISEDFAEIVAKQIRRKDNESNRERMEM